MEQPELVMNFLAVLGASLTEETRHTDVPLIHDSLIYSKRFSLCKPLHCTTTKMNSSACVM